MKRGGQRPGGAGGPNTGSPTLYKGLRVGLYTPTISGGNSHLSWFYDKGLITDPAHTGTSKRVPQAINRGPIRKSLPNSAYVYVAIQSHGLTPGAWTYYAKLGRPKDP